MLILAKATMAMMIGFILAIILGLVLIPILRKFHIGQSINQYLKEMKKTKELLMNNRYLFNKTKQNRLNINKDDVQ